MPRVSVVMPVYNGEDYLAEAVDSIINQKFEDFELLIIDDGSTDRTPDIIKEFVAKDSRVRYIQNEKNLGLSQTLNKGIKEAQGQYIAQEDWNPRKIVT